MTNYLIRRLFTLMIVLLLSSMAIFFILTLTPGGPFFRGPVQAVTNRRGLIRGGTAC